MPKNIPVKNINVPNGGVPPPIFGVPDDKPVYSSYTGRLIGYGNIPFGTKNDALPGDPNCGGNFHVVEFNPANQTFMAHYVPYNPRRY